LNPIGNRIDRKPQMPRRMLLLVAAGECLDMTLWFSATAAPGIAREFALGPPSARG
jgi:hypothetical protein